ncbi:MAG: nucleotide exchange factor GrpE [Christensenella sp.]
MTEIKDEKQDDVIVEEVIEEGQNSAEEVAEPEKKVEEKKEAKPRARKDKMQEKLKVLEAEKDEYIAALQRERADFDNYRKRNATLATTSFQNGVADATMAILPVLDNFERALTAECADEAFVEGISMIMRQLQETLKNLGVEEIPADGQFDPTVHNAVMQLEAEEFEPNQIVEVLQKGYSLNDRVLRHTMVKVAK